MRNPLIAIKGYKYWELVILKLLKECGYNAYILPNRRGDTRFLSRLRLINFFFIFLNKKWLLSSNVFLIGFDRGIFIKIALLFRKRISVFWIGSDVLQLKNINNRKLNNYKNKRVSHLAITQEIILELSVYGIEAELFEIVSDQIFPKVCIPFPEEPGILSYWSGNRKEFYGSEIVTQLAKTFPLIQFYVLGNNGQDQPLLRNVSYISYVENIDEVYKKVSILIRITEHDGLPSMVLELLARGRWIIWSNIMPWTTKATDFKEAKVALEQLLQKKDLNLKGMDYVATNYSYNIIKERALKVFSKQFGIIQNE